MVIPRCMFISKVVTLHISISRYLLKHITMMQIDEMSLCTVINTLLVFYPVNYLDIDTLSAAGGLWMLPSYTAILGWCCPKQPQPWPHLVCSAAGVPRALLGRQRVADVLDGLLSGGGQWSGGTSTHRAHRLWSRRCFYFTAARSETANICQLIATAQKRNYTRQLTLSGDTHFRKNSASFQIKSRSSLFCVKVLPKY